MTVSTGPDIDPFRKRQAPDVGTRFRKAREDHQRQADLMWLGTMAAFFSDHELRLLEDLGFLSPHDRDLLAQASRRVPARTGRPVPARTGKPTA